jgi:hypothetical protein
MKVDLKQSVIHFSEDMDEIFSKNKFVIFLCGPTLDLVGKDKAADLRKKLKEEFEKEGFEVVLGEDDGLEYLREKYDGMAHENELQFIQGYSNAVVLIASSVGSFCELGLFSHQHVRNNENRTHFILIVDEKYKNEGSYMNEGPVLAIDLYGDVFHVDFVNFNTAPLLKRLKSWRSVWATSGKGSAK